MRLMHHAEVVVQLGLLTYGSRSKQRVAARHLAVECTAAALASASGVGGGDGGSGLAAVGLDVLVVLIRGWSWVRKPPPELLTRMLEALVPGSGIGAGCGEHPHNTQNAHSAHGVRQGYGRLHTATLCDAAALVEPLAALEALTPPLLEVLINIAVRRAGNEAPTVVAAAAVAYGRAGVTDPRVAQAFLEATAVRRHGGAAAAAVGHIAEALGLCAKAAWYDPRVFAAAADALVARGVGGLTVRQTWSVLRAFAGTQHEHPLLKDALAAHAKALFIKSTSKTESGTESKFETNFEERDDPAGGHLKFVDRQRGDADAAATAAAAIEFAGLDTDVSGSGGAAAAAADVDANVDVNVTSTAPRQLSEERELTRQLSTLAGLVHGFSTMQVYDRELYERLAAGAAALLLRAMAIHLGESQPRALAAALTALLSGFAGAGFYPARLLEVMTAQQQGWTRSISVEQAHSLTCALAQLRHRDERLLDRLDEAAAAFLARTIAVAAAAAGLLSPAAGGNGSAAATATTTTAAVAAAAAATTPDVSWLPSFLDAACRQLSYPCPRTVATLAAAAATWDLDEYGNTVLRGLSKGKKEKRELAAVDSTAVVREGGSGAPETISRLQLLLLLVVEQSRSRQQGGSGSGSSSGSGGGPLLTPQWVCELVGALASSGARLREDEEQDLAWLLAKSIEPRMERKGAAAPAAAAAGGDESSSVWKGPMAEGLQAGGQTEMDAAAEQWPLPQRRRRRKGLTPAQAAAALDDTAACHLFRAVIASQYFSNTRNGDEAGAEDFDDEEAQSGYSYVHEEGAASRRGGSGGGGVRSDEEGDDGDGAGRRGLEAALHRALTAPVAAALLARAASAWHAAGLGTAAPRNAPHHVAISAHANAMVATMAPQPPRRLRRGGGAANSPLLSELLRSLGLPVFEQWETADGYFRVSRGLVLPGGRHVGVEVLPEAAFAASNAAANSDRSGPYPVLIGDAAFRARCLASRGWRLVALPEDEWAAAAMAGPAACMVLMRRHSGGL
ncbi:hypothetical protein Vretimale_6615 [Volvox reticuliferus]|nr:hypothetical protein Vretimale_6615 [Volvox reticuliferus]